MNPLGIRNGLAIGLVICGVVIMGISAHVENSARAFGVSTSTFTYDAFVGAFTLVIELGFIALRTLKPDLSVVSLNGEVIVSSLLWGFWLASGISTTVFTEGDRSICKHLDDLFDLPDFEGLDPQAIAVAKKIFQSACSELHAELAFIWIGFILATGIVGYTFFLAFRQHRHGNKLIWRTSFKNFVTYTHSTPDPFADPAGSRQGPVVGVASP